jgi:thiol-disulfide isomerase/thioredoxin
LLVWDSLCVPPFCYNGSMRTATATWLLIAAAAIAAWLGPRAWHHFNQPRLLHAGDRLTAIHLVSTSSTPYTLAPDGRPRLINVFATWCGPCREETPAFARAARKLQKRGFEVVGIDQEESAARVLEFAQDFHVPYDLYIDNDGITKSVLGARMIPTTILVGSDGRIRWIHPGPIDPQTLMALAKTT